MDTLMTLMAMAFSMSAVAFGSLSKNTWRNTAITWGLIAIGIVIFGINILTHV
jgi:hypothetical protein